MKSEKLCESTLPSNQANEAIADTLDIAAAQRKAKRRRLWLIAGLAAVFVAVLLLVDKTGWDLWLIAMDFVAVVLPLLSAAAGAGFFIYLLWQLWRHRPVRQTVMALLVCLAVLAAWIILPFALVLLGGFPAQR